MGINCRELRVWLLCWQVQAAMGLLWVVETFLNGGSFKFGCRNLTQKHQNIISSNITVLHWFSRAWKNNVLLLLSFCPRLFYLTDYLAWNHVSGVWQIWKDEVTKAPQPFYAITIPRQFLVVDETLNLLSTRISVLQEKNLTFSLKCSL